MYILTISKVLLDFIFVYMNCIWLWLIFYLKSLRNNVLKTYRSFQQQQIKIVVRCVLGQSGKKYFPDFHKNIKSNKKRKGKFLFTRFFYNL